MTSADRTGRGRLKQFDWEARPERPLQRDRDKSVSDCLPSTDSLAKPVQ